MLTTTNPSGKSIQSPIRDSVTGVQNNGPTDPPSIVSISDIHGYIESARSALLTVRDTPDFPPVVRPDSEGRLHWAGENYVLVFNGDLIDRGPANEEVLELVARLASEAPVGRVRTTLGNHEAIILSKEAFSFSHWYSGQVGSSARQTFLNQILSGEVVAAYEGYQLTYAHAGLPASYAAKEINDSLVTATEELLEADEGVNNTAVQRDVLEKYQRVLGVGQRHLKGDGAGIVWLDYDRLPPDAPPQVVGHTRHSVPHRKGDVFCQNVIRDNLDSPGGEAVFIETPQTLSALIRQDDRSVSRKWLLDSDQTI